MKKDELRKDFLYKRRNLSQDFVEKNSKKIISTLTKSKHFSNALTIFSYLSFDNEVDTLDFVKNIIGKKSIVVPVTKNKSSLKISRLNSFDDLSMGEYDILVPKTQHFVDPIVVDLVLVPGIAFDKHGNRIGYGFGNYDKILKKIKAPKIALCYSFQVQDNIPKENHDQPVDFIITEKGLTKCR